MNELAHDDTGGNGPLVVMLPGAGDLRSEYRFLVDRLRGAGHRVVAADLPGHGDSPTAAEYTVASTAAAIVGLIEALDGGPAVVVACSFAPAAAVWAAADRPDLIRGLVAISPHLHGDDSLKGRFLNAATRALMRGSWAGGLWAKLYAGFYKTTPPSDLDSELDRIRTMLHDSARRRAVRETLTAGRDGMAERAAAVQLPALIVLGSLDDHFADPVAEAEAVSSLLRGEHVVVDGAGHYPQVERPEVVGDAIEAFLAKLD